MKVEFILQVLTIKRCTDSQKGVVVWELNLDQKEQGSSCEASRETLGQPHRVVVRTKEEEEICTSL